MMREIGGAPSDYGCIVEMMLDHWETRSPRAKEVVIVEDLWFIRQIQSNWLHFHNLFNLIGHYSRWLSMSEKEGICSECGGYMKFITTEPDGARKYKCEKYDHYYLVYP